MTNELLRLPDADLRNIAAALRSGRLGVPYSGISLQRIVSSRVSDTIAHELQAIAHEGFSSNQIAHIIEIVLSDRLQRRTTEEVIQLVTTGPEAGATANRDTSVVVRELFASAEESVLLAGYAVYKGHRVFRALADRMQERPDLIVRLFLDVRRAHGDTSSTAEVVRAFGERFRRLDWPQDRPFPEVYYFPLSLEETAEKRAALHAKCVVVDSHAVFVSSANFTEAAQERNIEVGLFIDSPPLAKRLIQHFDTMLSERLLHPVFD